MGTMPDAPSLADTLSDRPVVLDGGLATELERRGHDLSSSLWSARLLVDAPAEIVEVHRAYAAAGAEVATTASYQLSYAGAASAGVDRDATDRLLRLSVQLAREGGSQWVAASVGPYGATLADGSEYRGDDGLEVAALGAWHRPRLEVLAAAGADVLAVETIPSIREVEALVVELDRLDVPAWLSVTCDGARLRDGTPAEAAFEVAADCDAVFAVGVNCTAPDDVNALLPLAAAYRKPVVVYPNSGEAWDPVHRAWTGESGVDTQAVAGWLGVGARLVGGCCRVGPDRIAAISAAVRAGVGSSTGRSPGAGSGP
jgi:homocysteine S-methyltransferase